MSETKDNRWHSFQKKVLESELPAVFTNPFHYSPCAVVKQAVSEVMLLLSEHEDWMSELSQGKMLGVLVVVNRQGEVGYLVAYSGNLLGRNDIDFFVPAIYDLLNPLGTFRIQEQHISEINKAIADVLKSEEYLSICKTIEENREQIKIQLQEAKQRLREQKQRRKELRESATEIIDEESLQRESQYEKAEYKRFERRLSEELHASEQLLEPFDVRLIEMREERRRKSQELQEWLFKQFVITNNLGEECNLTDLFLEVTGGLPPAGAGECAGPKLLNYAYREGLRPVAMGEFWWGKSPKGEVRNEGYFYPSCHNKCRPILGFMLKGLNVESSLVKKSESTIEVIYEDEDLYVINKPAERLSVPGIEGGESIQEELQRTQPHAEEWRAVHRLDLSTSGILMFAKNRDAYVKMQQQFEQRHVKKRYVALLDGILEEKSGWVSLPLKLNVNDRPRQMVDFVQGKKAVTRYEVLWVHAGKTLVWFYPETGRTHQLRVHAAHRDGLNAPIVGDRLYGHASNRLMLHAAEVTFRHPKTNAVITLQCEPDIEFSNR